jgi:hypothetical protein
MNGLTPQYLIILYNDYCRNQIIGNVGWGYAMLRDEITKRISKEKQNEIINEEVEKYTEWIDGFRINEPEYYERWHMHDLPTDRNNRTIQYRAKDRIVRMLFDELKQEKIKIESIIIYETIPKS